MNMLDMSGTPLGNFLSGMETSFANRFFLWCPHLGNFLSGMETSASLREGGVQRALETSLVEWKPAQEAASAMELLPWKLP